jgi:succinoglycan biosynthesis transport protein ExoP
MGIHRALAILRARIVPLLAVILITMGATTVVSLIITPRYTATVTLVVDSSRIDPVTGTSLPAMIAGDYLNTQLEVIQSQAVALKVVQNLNLADDPGAEKFWLEDTNGQGSIEHWLALGLLKHLKAEVGKQNSIITLTYTSTDPKRAATLANAFAQAYVRTNLDLRVAPAKEASEWFGAQISDLKGNLEKAQAKFTEYQRAKGIISPDDKVDVETNRLSELSAQLSLAQSSAIDAVSRKRQLDQYFKEGRNAEALPDAVGNALINSLKQQLSGAEAKLTQLAGQLGKNHPEYQRASAEVEQIKRQLSVELETLATSIANSARVAQAKEADLRAAVAAQKTRVLELNKEKGRDDMAVLVREVESAQKAYDTASQRFSEVRLESRISQTNVAILTPAVPPLKPSFPDWLVNLVLSFVLGSMLGVTLAFMMEHADRRIRAPEDLEQVPGLALLGVLRNTSTLKRSTGTKRGFNPLAILRGSGA